MKTRTLTNFFISLLFSFFACDYDIIPDETGGPGISNKPIACINAPSQEVECIINDCTIQFEALCSSTDATEFYWYVSGNEAFDSDKRTYTHTYTKADDYLVELIVFNTQGQSDTATLNVTVRKPLQACFMLTPNACYVDSCHIAFDATCSEPQNDIIEYEWHFGNGNSVKGADKEEVKHEYNKVGTYTAKLIVTNSKQVKDSVTKEIQVLETGDLMANFISDNDSVCYDNTCMVMFDASGTLPDVTEITNFEWIFGDGNRQEGAAKIQVAHQYSNADTYTATLKVTNGNGETASANKSIEIREKLTADFNITGGCNATNCGVSFISNANPAATIVSYLWNFGDGNTSTQTNPTHTYLNAGNYQVTLTVTDDKGKTSIKISEVIQIFGAPTATFSAKCECNLSTDGDCNIAFDAGDSNSPGSPIVSYKWDFDGDGRFDVSKDNDFTNYVFETEGSQNVTLKIENEAGLSHETSKTINVYNVNVDFTFPNQTYYENCTPVQFINNSTGATSFLWDFGDGNTSIEENPVHTYINPTSFTVTLTAINGPSLQRETKQTINIVTPSIMFEKTFASGNGCRDVLITADKGYLLAGYTNSKGAGNFDAYLIKTDVNGNLQWEKTYGGSSDDFGNAISITADGGYLLAGSTSSKGAGRADAYLIKTDVNGNLQWDKTYGGSLYDAASGLTIAPDGGYLLAGETTTSIDDYIFDAYLKKTDSNGDLQWDKTFGGSGDEEVLAISIASDGGYLLAGSTRSKGAGNFDAYLIKTDVNGNLQWDKTYGGSEYDRAFTLTIAPDGGYLLAGETTSKGAGGSDVYLIKTDTNGNLQWEKTYGSTGNEIALSIATTDDCGYVIAGASNGQFYLIKTDSEGNIN